MTAKILSKYPPKFKKGDSVVVLRSHRRGMVCEITDIIGGWPYCTYKVTTEREGQFIFNETELGLHRTGNTASG
jgi:hypothetical protein